MLKLQIKKNNKCVNSNHCNAHVHMKLQWSNLSQNINSNACMTERQNCSLFPTILLRAINFFVLEKHNFTYYFCRGFYHAPLVHTFIMNIYNWCQIHSHILHDKKQTRHFTNRRGRGHFIHRRWWGCSNISNYTDDYRVCLKIKVLFTIIIHPSWKFCYMLPFNNLIFNKWMESEKGLL